MVKIASWSCRIHIVIDAAKKTGYFIPVPHPTSNTFYKLLVSKKNPGGTTPGHSYLNIIIDRGLEKFSIFLQS